MPAHHHTVNFFLRLNGQAKEGVQLFIAQQIAR